MQVIKPVLIICFIVLLLVVFRHRGRAGMRAGSRLAALGLGLAATVFVVDPGILQWLASLLGVVRGTDLLLYALVVVFALTAMALYFGQREARVELQKLARRVALSDAVLQYGPPGGGDATSPRPTPAGERLVSASTGASSPTQTPIPTHTPTQVPTQTSGPPAVQATGPASEQPDRPSGRSVGAEDGTAGS